MKIQNLLLTSFLLSLLLLSCKEENKIAEFHDLRQVTWLPGRWKMEGKQIVESWQRMADGNLSGLVETSENGEQKILEQLSITENNGEFYYSANVSDQNQGQTINFKLTFVNDNTLIFENADHDFPQVIYYAINDDLDQISVKLSGQNKNQKFVFKKMD